MSTAKLWDFKRARAAALTAGLFGAMVLAPTHALANDVALVENTVVGGVAAEATLSNSAADTATLDATDAGVSQDTAATEPSTPLTDASLSGVSDDTASEPETPSTGQDTNQSANQNAAQNSTVDPAADANNPEISNVPVDDSAVDDAEITDDANDTDNVAAGDITAADDVVDDGASKVDNVADAGPTTGDDAKASTEANTAAPAAAPNTDAVVVVEPSTFNGANLSDGATVPTKLGWYQASDKSWYYVEASTSNPGTNQYRTGWLVTTMAPGQTKAGSNQRYWLASDGKLVRSKLIDAGNGWWAYALDGGNVVIGKYTLGDHVYLADSDGRLMATGWHWSSAFGDGNQLYYIDTNTHCAIVGYSAQGGEHYTLSQGYVLRLSMRSSGKRITYSTASGTKYVDARATGKNIYLATSKDGKLLSAGWHWSTAYGGGNQYYYVESSTYAAKLGYSANGGHHFTTANAYALRNSKQSSGNKVYVSKSNAMLLDAGWTITDAYTKGTNHRYWIDSKAHAAIIGYSTDGYSHYTLGYGYILGGKMRMGNGMVLTDRHGKLADKKGWLQTGTYDNGTSRRYYIDNSATNGVPGAHLGYFSVGGKRYYANYDSGYLFIGRKVVSTYTAAPAGGDGNWVHTDTMMITDSTGALLDHNQVGLMIVAKTRTQLGRGYTHDDSAAYPNNAFNCSGLTWWVYQDAIGAILSHNQGYYSYYANQVNKENSQAWAIIKRNGWKTNVADLVPGDLVFFSPLGNRYHTGHVGVYVGNGQMIDAYPGRGVSQRSVYQSGFVGGGFPISLC